jgi:hypothetical protein
MYLGSRLQWCRGEDDSDATQLEDKKRCRLLRSIVSRALSFVENDAEPFLAVKRLADIIVIIFESLGVVPGPKFATLSRFPEGGKVLEERL